MKHCNYYKSKISKPN